MRGAEGLFAPTVVVRNQFDLIAQPSSSLCLWTKHVSILHCAVGEHHWLNSLLPLHKPKPGDTSSSPQKGGFNSLLLP